MGMIGRFELKTAKTGKKTKDGFEGWGRGRVPERPFSRPYENFEKSSAGGKRVANKNESGMVKRKRLPQIRDL